MDNSIEFLYSRFLLSDGVSIDTRTIQKGNIFFAISGPNFNANHFAKEALEKGATYCVVDDKNLADDERIIYTHDALKSLQELAAFHRGRFNRPVIAITGSNGKTTTKELISKVLERKYTVHATKGNYNNHIGVPLTLLHIHPQVEIAIIEMGANHVGEIASYCEVAKPTHGLITNIGRAHTETFGGIDGVIRGKSELFDFLRKNDGVAFINMKDPVLSNMVKRFKQPYLYPADDLTLKETSPFLALDLGGHASITKIVGKYNFTNIGAAVALGRYFGVPDTDILNAISMYQADNARSQVIKKGEVTIILDAYNANPDSMKAALENLSEQEGRLFAIIGDMNELEDPDTGHQEILDYAESLGIKNILTVGEKIGRVAKSHTHYQTKEKLEKYLTNVDFSGCTILLKASRTIKLESILNSIGSWT